jgi:hypothetical protein
LDQQSGLLRRLGIAHKLPAELAGIVEGNVQPFNGALAGVQLDHVVGPLCPVIAGSLRFLGERFENEDTNGNCNHRK